MTPIVEAGTILLGGKYRVEKLLGQGAMGYVVAARHEFLGELHALKLMQPEALKNAEAVERFMREARAYARLKSDHAVRVHDFGRLEDGAPFIAMEHLDGEDLQEILDAQKVFPFQDAALYVLQACDAIAEAHALGIVHRDLKPSNLFLTRRANGTPCVKVLDFGISKALDDAANSSPKLTATNTVMGTAYYMSPEQVRNSKATDHRGDIWALGVILYEFATGQVPFGGENFFDISTKAVNSQPIPPSQLRPGIPADFDYIVSRCLEKLPEMRFQSVSELAAALRRLVGTEVASGVAVISERSLSTKVRVDGELDEVDVDKDTATLKRPSHVDDSNETLIIPSSKSESAIPPAASDDPLQSPGNSFAKVFLRNQAERLEAQRIKRRRENAKRAILFVLGLGALIWGVNFYETKGKSWLSDFRARNAIGSASASASASADAPPSAPETISASPSASSPTHSSHRSNSTKGTNPSGSANSSKSAASTAKSTSVAPSAAAPPSTVTAPATSAASPAPGPKTDPKSGSVDTGQPKPPKAPSSSPP